MIGYNYIGLEYNSIFISYLFEFIFCSLALFILIFCLAILAKFLFKIKLKDKGFFSLNPVFFMLFAFSFLLSGVLLFTESQSEVYKSDYIFYKKIKDNTLNVGKKISSDTHLTCMEKYKNFEEDGIINNYELRLAIFLNKSINDEHKRASFTTIDEKVKIIKDEFNK